jgi:nitroreductase
VAAAVAGLEPHVRLLPDPGQPLLLATIGLAGRHHATPGECELHAAIRRRQTNREPVSSRAVPPGIRAELAEAAGLEGALLHFLGHYEAKRVLRLVADAERDLLADPGYRAELARWAGGQRDRDGIPDSALGPSSLEGPAPVRDFTPRTAPTAGPLRLVRGASATGRAVGPLRRQVEWLRAGQALQRLLLTATVRGIAVCPLTQPLESADAWQVRDPRSAAEQPLMILRIGYGLPLPPGAPRRPVSEVLDRPHTGQDPPQHRAHL